VILRASRAALCSFLVLACAFTAVVLGTTAEPASPQLEPAADLSQFDPGNIITDGVFYDSGAMTAAQVQSFLDAKGARCSRLSGGPACLKDYVQTTPTRAADSYCTGKYVGASNESAAMIIKKVGLACDINPRVLLVTLQKEMGFITSSGPTSKMYTRAMGMGCPDNTGGTCDSQYNGFFNQLYAASKQFQRYRANPTGYAHAPNRTNQVRYNPNPDCGSSSVYIENQATASLYNYTPYQPNKAALAAGYGTGNSCSAYGNRNFYNYFTDWFGSTQTGGRDVDAPVGRLEAVLNRGDSVLVRGWAFDPNSPTSTVRLGIVADGEKIASDTTDVARADVASANYGAGSTQGFETKLPMSLGTHNVCVYAANIGAGYTTPRLGCATVTVTSEASFNPKGRFTDVRVAGTRLVVEGWVFDPDNPRSTSTVRVWAGGLRLGDVKATLDRADVARYYPSAGSAHGFKLDTRLTPGSHRVCVYAFNRGIGTANPSLGCRTVTVTADPVTAPVTSGSPIGRLESFVLDGQDLAIRGWAFDPDDASAPAKVQVLANGKLVAEPVSTADRPDVQKKYPYAGSAHGYSWKGILPAGTYPLCVRVVDVGIGSTKAFTCLTRTVVGDPKSNPIGGPRVAEVTGSGVRFAGWSYDPDVPTEPVTVRIYEGSTTLATVVADDLWPDVGKYHPAAGSLHGFEWTGTLPAGSHSICAQATNLKYGTADPRLGCMTVTVVRGAAESAETVAPPTDTSAPATSSPATSAPSTGATETAATTGATGEPTGTAAEPTP
jgi:hypothetical protein